MLTVRVIPCLDVTGGRVVKGVRFQELRDAGDPVAIAQAYEAQGADELVFLDITASSDQRETMIDVVARTAEVCFMPVTVGGGIRSVDNIDALLRAGADKVSLNTAALADPGLLSRASARFGNQCIVLAIDAKRDPAFPSGWQVWSHGGRRPAGRDALAWAREAVDRGAGEILLTSMDQDGMQNGYDLALNRALADGVTVPVIASGGAGHLGHLVEVVRAGHASAVLAASIFHFGTYTIPQAKAALAAAGLPVRQV